MSGMDDEWTFSTDAIRPASEVLIPVLPELVPVDQFECGYCGAVLWMAGQMEVLHDCVTGEVAPA